MTTADAERFGRIARSIQFGATFKDLRFLVGLVEKLDKAALSSQPSAVTESPKRALRPVTTPRPSSRP